MTFSAEQTKELQKKLDPANVKPPAPGKYGSYIEGWHAIAEANRIFGHDGWSYQVKSITQTNSDQKPDGKWAVGYLAVISVSVDGVIREDAGHGQGHGKSLGDAYDSAIKEAVTDGLKRALRSFGNPFGLALYDKTHANVGVDVDWSQERDDLTRMLTACGNDIQAVVDLWKTSRMQDFIKTAPQEFSSPIIKIKDEKKQAAQPMDKVA